MDLLMGPMTKAAEPATKTPTPPAPEPKLKSKPPPTLDESQDSLKLALETMKVASRKRIRSWEEASEVLADEDLQRVFVEVDLDVDIDE